MNLKLEGNQILSPDFTLMQSDAGALAVHFLVYNSKFPEPHLVCSYDITIYSGDENSQGYGDIIFKGELSELIRIVKEVNQCCPSEKS